MKFVTNKALFLLFIIIFAKSSEIITDSSSKILVSSKLSNLKGKLNHNIGDDAKTNLLNDNIDIDNNLREYTDFKLLKRVRGGSRAKNLMQIKQTYTIGEFNIETFDTIPLGDTKDEINDLKNDFLIDTTSAERIISYCQEHFCQIPTNSFTLVDQIPNFWVFLCYLISK